MAIHYIDMENGINKPTLTNTAYAFSPDGTKVRIFSSTLIEHGLTTGEQVVLSAFTAWLNATWTVTVIDKYCFELQGATWQATADFSGTSTPVTPTANDGSSWALATKGNVSVGNNDTVYVAKTPDPVSLGQNVTFTYKSKILSLVTPVTQDVDQANVNNWTVVAPNTISVVTTATLKKLGNGVIQITKNNAFTAPGKVAYKTLPAQLDLSGYTKLSFYFGSNQNYNAYFGGYKICLCSDAIGNVVVDEFIVPALYNSSQMQAIVLDKGAALGNAINSVAIYMGNTQTGAYNIWINHIFACNNVTLNTLISKTNTIFSEQLAIESITGTTVIIDEGRYTSNRGYSGITETVGAYIREPIYCIERIVTQLATKPAVLFGINKITDLQDGETWLGGGSGYLNSGGSDLVSQVEISNIGVVRGGTVIGVYGKWKNIQCSGGYLVNSAITLNGYSIENVRATHNTTQTTATPMVRIGSLNINAENKNIFVNSNSIPAGTNLGLKVDTNNCYYENVTCINNSYGGFGTYTPGLGSQEANGNDNYFLNLTAIDNGNFALTIQSAGNVFNNLITNGNAYFLAKTFLINSPEQSGNYMYWVEQSCIGGVINANRTNFGKGDQYSSSYARWQTAVKQGNDPGAWECHNHDNFLRLAEIPVAKDIQITIRAWVSNRVSSLPVTSKLIIRKRNSPLIISEDYYTLVPDYGITWREISITFTPIETGIVVLELYGQSMEQGSYNIYVGSISMT